MLLLVYCTLPCLYMYSTVYMSCCSTGELIAVEPYTVQLKFEPSGRPQAEDNYYLSFKENICVVCGSDESYLRKSIVPHDYRRYFPVCMKDHHCHDILLMCYECHRVSNFYDEQLRQKLAKEYDAPVGNKGTVAWRRFCTGYCMLQSLHSSNTPSSQNLFGSLP